MDVVFVCPEVAPFSAYTPAGDASAALPKALRGLGHRVTIVSPLWASIDPAARHLARRLVKLELEHGGQRTSLALFDGRSPGGVDLQFLANEALFPRNGSPLEQGPETAERWGLFGRGVIELLRRRDAAPDVVHLYGWQTAPLAVLLGDDAALGSVATVLTLHDAASPLYARDALALYGISESWWRIDGVEFFGKMSPLKAGVQAATRITAPSSAFARELVAPSADDPDGRALGAALEARGKAVVGITDAVDVALWNSATDPWLESRFDPMDVVGAGAFGKHRCKTGLQKQLALPVRDDVPLIAAVGIFGAGSSAELLIEAGPSLLRNDLQVVLVAEPGSEPSLIGRAHQLAARWPDRIAVRADADVGLVHRAIGACDLLLTPQLRDPVGARAMQAHRYGALPIGFRWGGSSETIVDCDAPLSSGSGFLYDEATAPALLATIQRALAAYARREAFRALAHRVMMIDHSWDRSARLYERLYRGARASLARSEGSTASDART